MYVDAAPIIPAIIIGLIWIVFKLFNRDLFLWVRENDSLSTWIGLGAMVAIGITMPFIFG